MLDHISFYPDADVACKATVTHEALTISFEGITSKGAFTGRPLPFSANHTIPGADGGAPRFITIGKVGWVRFEKLGLKSGDNIRGELVLDAPKTSAGEPGNRVEGRFVAKVCNLF